jgi:ELWxxDGT repeat protein
MLIIQSPITERLGKDTGVGGGYGTTRFQRRRRQQRTRTLDHRRHRGRHPPARGHLARRRGGSGAVASAAAGRHHSPSADGARALRGERPVPRLRAWVTDGTAEGTRLVADINRSESGLLGSFPFGLRRARRRPGDLRGRRRRPRLEPWVTDGTAEGTSRSSTCRQGLSISSTASLCPGRRARGLPRFDARLGGEPWVADGTAAGHPSGIADISPGQAGSLGPGLLSVPW